MAALVVLALGVLAGGGWLAFTHRPVATMQPADEAVFARVPMPDGGEVAIAVPYDLARDGGELRRIAPDRRITWRASLRHPLEGGLLVVGDRVVVRVRDEGPALMRAYSLATGELAWESADTAPIADDRPEVAGLGGDGVFELVVSDPSSEGATWMRMRSLSRGEVLFEVPGPRHDAYEHLYLRPWSGRLFLDASQSAAVYEVDLASGALSTLVAPDAGPSCVTTDEVVTIVDDGAITTRPLAGGAPVTIAHLPNGTGVRVSCSRDGSRTWIAVQALWGGGDTVAITPMIDGAWPLGASAALYVVEHERLVAAVASTWGAFRPGFASPRDGSPPWTPTLDPTGHVVLQLWEDPPPRHEGTGIDRVVEVTLDPATLAVSSQRDVP